MTPKASQQNDPIEAVEPPATSRCIDWYHEGETRIVEVGGVKVIVRFIGRRGRRARILIEAPAEASFRTLDLNEIAGAPGSST